MGKPVRADQDLDGGRAKRVIVPLRGTDWGGGVVSPGFVPLRGTHLGFDSLAALRATCAFGAGREGVIADATCGVPTLDSAIITKKIPRVTREYPFNPCNSLFNDKVVAAGDELP